MAVLRDVAHAHLGAVADGSFRDVLSVEQNFTAGYFFQSREALNELGLAVSIDTCDADNLAFSYIKGNIFDGVRFRAPCSVRSCALLLERCRPVLTAFC